MEEDEERQDKEEVAETKIGDPTPSPTSPVGALSHRKKRLLGTTQKVVPLLPTPESTPEPEPAPAVTPLPLEPAPRPKLVWMKRKRTSYIHTPPTDPLWLDYLARREKHVATWFGCVGDKEAAKEWKRVRDEFDREKDGFDGWYDYYWAEEPEDADMEESTRQI